MSNRRRRRSYTDWRRSHSAERQGVSSLYGGVDADVRQLFFSLSPELLECVLSDYKEQYGARARGYAKQVYGEWKSGKVQMSGRVSERLLAIVPRHLDFAAKYDLLEKLCRRREGTRLRVAVSHNMTVQEAMGVAIRAIQSARVTRLPDFVTERLCWLTDNDGQAAQSLLSQVLDREYEFIVCSVQQELLQLLALSSGLAGRPIDIQAQREITLPGVVVQLSLDCHRKWRSGSCTMPDESQSQPSKSPVRGLAPVPNATPSDPLAPIQNPHNLLEEALRRMAPEKQAEVLGKAADEALRLQVKQKENDLDLGIVSEKIDQAGRVARDAAQIQNVDVCYETEHKSKQGNTRIRVASQPLPPPPQQRMGCLVLLGLCAGAITGVVWLA